MENTVGRLREESPFSKHLGPAIQIGNTPVKIRLPKDWGATLLAEDADEKRRLMPMEGATISGLQQTYEGFVGVGEVTDGKQGKLSYYCYLAVNDTTSRYLRDPAAALRGRLKNRIFVDGTSDFQPVAITTPTGQSLQWRKATSEGPQPFHYVDAQGKEHHGDQPGLIEFYAYSKGNYQVMICWRLPKSIKGDFKGAPKIDAWSKLMAGSVTFQ